MASPASSSAAAAAAATNPSPAPHPSPHFTILPPSLYTPVQARSYSRTAAATTTVRPAEASASAGSASAGAAAGAQLPHSLVAGSLHRSVDRSDSRWLDRNFCAPLKGRCKAHVNSLYCTSQRPPTSHQKSSRTRGHAPDGWHGRRNAGRRKPHPR